MGIALCNAIPLGRLFYSQPNRIVVFEVVGVINIDTRVVVSPHNASDGKVINADGYTNLERYINSLPLTGCPCAPEFVSR